MRATPSYALLGGEAVVTLIQEVCILPLLSACPSLWQLLKNCAWDVEVEEDDADQGRRER